MIWIVRLSVRNVIGKPWSFRMLLKIDERIFLEMHLYKRASSIFLHFLFFSLNVWAFVLRIIWNRFATSEWNRPCFLSWFIGIPERFMKCWHTEEILHIKSNIYSRFWQKLSYSISHSVCQTFTADFDRDTATL